MISFAKKRGSAVPGLRLQLKDAASRKPFRIYLGLALLVGLGVGRIVATYHVFNQTFDEPYHLASGMEWWDQGKYQYERLHPPLARIFIAVGPYLDGLHSMGHSYTDRGHLDEGNAILYSRNTYERNLTLARIGILPFFIGAAILVWYWSRSIFGESTAWAATLLFTTLPPILAHSGLATTDMAVAACLGMALFAFMRWLDRPDRRQTVELGVALGLAALSKFTALLFLPGCLLCLAILCWYGGRSLVASPLRRFRRHSRALALCILVTLLVIWAGYRFSITPPLKAGGVSQGVLDRAFRGHESLHRLASAISETPLPLGEFVAGLGSAWDRTSEGHPAFLLGNYSNTGWWYFFPVVLAVKTPLPFTILAVVGVALLIRRVRTRLVWQHWGPIVCAAVILVACLPSPVNAGVRHILPIYTMLAIVAGFGAASLLSLSLRYKILAVLLLGWNVSSSLSSHPDYLAYLNELAGSHPERILSGSDVDWGQDLKRLSQELKHLGVSEVSMSYFGTADPAHYEMPRLRPLLPYHPATGWVAISVFNLNEKAAALQQADHSPVSPYAWLTQQKPFARAGKSIFLYYVPSKPIAADRGAPRGCLTCAYSGSSGAL